MSTVENPQMLDPAARTELGEERMRTLLGNAECNPQTLFDSSWRDYLFAEVWTRPGLDLRARYLISMCSGASSDTPAHILDGYVRGALQQGGLTLSELRETALHFAVYGGWSRGAVLDAAITRVAEAMSLAPANCPPLRAEAWNPTTRLEQGAANFHSVMTFGGPPPATAYFTAGILNFVFGEMWMREGLDQRSRRWVTLVGVADSSADIPIRTHIYAAMASGNASLDEMNEFALQYAIHSGWPRASVVQSAILQMAGNLKKRLTWDGKPLDEQ